MRVTVSLLALLAATPAIADTVFAQAPVASAVVYPDGATLTLRAELELPAGTHTVLLPYPAAADAGSLPRIATSEGVSVGTLGFRRGVVADPSSFYTPAQTAAAEVVEAAEAALTAAADDRDTARVALEALEARAAYLAGVGAPQDAGPDDILALADLVAAQTAQTRAAMVDARAALRPLDEALGDRQADLDAARADLARLSPPAAENDMLSIELSVAEAGPVALEMTEQSWAAGWRVDYDMNLDRASGEITVDRKLIVEQNDSRIWSDVALTLSTARPSDQIAPSEVHPDRADIYEPQLTRAAGAPAPMMEAAALEDRMAPVIDSAPMKVAGLHVDGLALSYVYPDPVTVAPGEAAELSLDTLTLPATQVIQAAPRWDDTAFLVAGFTNATGEPILPGEASLSRDGHFVGRAAVDMIPAGAEAELAFGPVDSIRLDTIFKRNEEGGSGLINKSSTRDQQITFSVQNLSDEVQEVRALYPLTFSEKEELQVKIAATPAPDDTDIDDRRGVSAWNLTLAPGETREVQISVSLGWPEGKALNWAP